MVGLGRGDARMNRRDMLKLFGVEGSRLRRL